jgi:glycosyltransferase involved in cell wall biosynthesis
MSLPHLCLLGDANSVHVRRWAAEMQARDFRVSVLTARPEAQSGVTQRVMAPVRRSTDWLWRVGQARRHLRELAPDIVHAHYITSYGYLAARCGRRPLFMTAWGSDLLLTPRRHPLLRALTGWTLRQADVLTADSHDLLAQATAPGYRMKASAHLVHWGVDLQRFTPVPWADKPVGFHLASLRAWEPNYRIELIVEALAALRRQCPQADAQLHLMGGGSQEAALRGRVSALGLVACVHFHGRLDDAQMQAVLGRCHVSVSVPLSDATSVSVLESMACGLPVVASDLPANRHWLDVAGEPRSLECLVDLAGAPATAASALARALRSLCEHPSRAQCWGARHRERMVREGDRAVQMDTMAALYRERLTGRPA